MPGASRNPRSSTLGHITQTAAPHEGVRATSTSGSRQPDAAATPPRLPRNQAKRVRMAAAGDEVAALWPEDGEWYRATVRAVAADGSLELDYEDGDYRAGVPLSETRPVGGAATETAAADEEDDGMGDLLDAILDAPDPPQVEVSADMRHAGPSGSRWALLGP